MGEKKKNATFRTQKIRVKKGHRLYQYCDQMCLSVKNLYNVSNYYVRQVFSGLRKEPCERHVNEVEAIEYLNSLIPKLNDLRIATVEKKRAKELAKAEDKRKFIPDVKLYDLLDENNRAIGYNLLDAAFKLSGQQDYIAMPAQANQQTMKVLFQDWKSFFESIKDYKINPGKYTGRPKQPKYVKKNGRKTCVLTNQICTIKEEKYLRFPKTKHKLNIGKLGIVDGKLKQVRIVPGSNHYTIELVFENGENPEKLTEKPERVLGIDLGVNNFATMANNVGQSPLIIKGKVVKSINQFFNKQRARYYGILRQGKEADEGLFYSNRLSRLDAKKADKMSDFMHKASRKVVDYAEELGIDTIVIGKNDNWKKDVVMRRIDKQAFIYVPYNQFINMVKYKAAEKGITVVVSEESYTSKASFLDGDTIPAYGKECGEKQAFSGKRIKRGLYRSKSGVLINADVNGACNIIRKVVPAAFERGNRGVVDAPFVLSIA